MYGADLKIKVILSKACYDKQPNSDEYYMSSSNSHHLSDI